MVQEYDAADGPGARGAILRREGLYDSHVQKWRKAVEEGRLRDTPVAGLTPSRDRSRQAQLEAENVRLQAELDMTKSMLEVMGKHTRSWRRCPRARRESSSDRGAVARVRGDRGPGRDQRCVGVDRDCPLECVSVAGPGQETVRTVSGAQTQGDALGVEPR
ncbi:MAG: hypothetical protein IPK37_03595 [Austwickia sp.]|nr:MAG: hypothetical protein IPK37_03595 [Austwickia sp.]